MKKALVFGAGGFIGSHMVSRLKSENFFVRGVDLKKPDFQDSVADEFIIFDLAKQDGFKNLLSHDGDAFDEIYQYAADMGGAGFIFTGDNDAKIMHSSVSINLNLLDLVEHHYDSLEKLKIFYSSSACIYPQQIQETTNNPGLKEDFAYPANPDSEYGWEKLFSERLFLTYYKNFGLNVRIARFHNIYGPQGTWDGGKEKVPAAVCRKVANSNMVDEIEIWGDGKQTRSFLFIEDCIEATRRLMNSDYSNPINIGSEEMVSINQLVEIVSTIANKKISIKHIDGPLGVRGRNSDNELIKEILDWDYKFNLEDGIKETYLWIEKQIIKQN